MQINNRSQQPALSSSSARSLRVFRRATGREQKKSRKDYAIAAKGASGNHGFAQFRLSIRIARASACEARIMGVRGPLG